MRIAFAHYSTEDDIGGVSTWLIRLASELRRQGWPVAVLLPHTGNHPARSTIASALRAADVEVVLQPQLSSDNSAVLQTLDFLNTWKPTVFLPQCQAAHFIAAAIAGRQGLPWALTVHSDDPQYWSVLNVIKVRRSGGRIICVSRYLADQIKLRGLDPDPIVIPCGVPVSNHRVHHSREPFHVVYSGRVVEMQKRMSLVLESLMRACQASPHIRATIIGDGTALQQCQDRVRAAGLMEAIRFTGRVSVEDVHNYLSEAQAILLMSDFEGLPVALMEAMAMGVVPVARAIPSGIPELVKHGETGLLTSENPSEAAESLLELVENPDLWQRCSMASHDLITSSYGEPITLPQWRNVIHDLLAASSPHYPMHQPVLTWIVPWQAATINFLWALPQRKRNLAYQRRLWLAKAKHLIKQAFR